MYKLLLTDGFQQAVAFDFCGFLKTCVPGTKIAVKNVFVRRGVLLLTPKDTILLGGEVKNFRVNSTSDSSANNETPSTLNQVGIPSIPNYQQQPRNDKKELEVGNRMERTELLIEDAPYNSYHQTNQQQLPIDRQPHSIAKSSHSLHDKQSLTIAPTSSSSIAPFSYSPTVAALSSSSSSSRLNPIVSLCSPIVPTSPTEMMEMAYHEEEDENPLFPIDCNSPMLSEGLLSPNSPKQDRSFSNNSNQSRHENASQCLKYWKDLPLCPPSSQFRMHGFTKRVSVFQTSSDGTDFEVMIDFDDGVSPTADSAVVSSAFVVAFLGMSPADYNAIIQAVMDQKTVKKTKKEIINRFQNFQGVFWVEKKTSELIVTNNKGVDKTFTAEIVLVRFAEDDIIELC
eukprot:CAMPEP_0170116562 /NCGR_PEP_ID=MMETSP0020_2-20130122/12356_1 /TAXON_ID=98059 /ORGANISM="Dinobryon sp., Strain UTEXLB2267" /LENGTH=397 /DNA_ID=CAMNT_0010344729 /DNA_START=379 /DNA_END=1569 /DNA_ORIENTATION=-